MIFVKKYLEDILSDIAKSKITTEYIIKVPKNIIEKYEFGNYVSEKMFFNTIKSLTTMKLILYILFLQVS